MPSVNQRSGTRNIKSGIDTSERTRQQAEEWPGRASASSGSPAADSPQPRIVQTSYKPPEPTDSIDAGSAIKLLRSQPNHYAVIEMHGRRLLVKPDDVVTVPRMKDVRAGDVLQLTRILEVGSRDYTLRAPFVPRIRDPKRYRMGLSVERATLPSEGPDGVQLRAVVVEHTAGPMEKRIKHTMGSKHVIRLETRERYTRLRIGQLHLAASSQPAPSTTPAVAAAKRALLQREIVPQVSASI